MHNVPKWSDTLVRQMLQDFKIASDHFETLCIKGLKYRESICVRVYYRLIYRLEVFLNWVMARIRYNISALNFFSEFPEIFRRTL